MALIDGDGPRLWRAPRITNGASQLQARLWAVFDLTLAAMAILLSTDAVNRFGLASPAWLAVYAMTLIRIGVSWRSVADLLSRHAYVLVYPAICLASVVWSPEKAFSLASAVQLAMSVIIACLVGGRFALRTICALIFFIIVLTAALSLLNWATGIFGNVYAGSGGLLGIYTQKNALGQRCLVAVLAGIALLVVSRGRDPAFSLMVLVGLIILGLALNLSKSVTSILLVLPTGAALLLMSAHTFNRGAVFFVVGLAVVVAAFAPMLLAISGIDIVTLVLNEFGKDATLTGRTLLWDIAESAISQNWLFGVGFMAFWRAEAFVNFVLLAQSIGGETALGFHNFILETWVGTGLLGLFAILLLVLISLSRCVRLYLQTRSVESAFASTFVATSMILALLGASLYRQHEFSMMLIVVFGVATGEAIRRGRVNRNA